MGPLSTPFILMPAVGAILAGYALRDWRLAGAVASGGGALIFGLVASSHPFAVLALPFVAGIALGALILMPVLAYRPRTSVWSRMTIALVVTAAVAFANLIFIAGRA